MLRVRTMRSLVAAPGVALLLGTGGAVAAPVEPRLTAEPERATPGTTVVLSGKGFPRNARIVLRAGPPGDDAQRIGSARTGRRGVFSATIRIRANADGGRFVAFACYDACSVKARAAFRVVAR